MPEMVLSVYDSESSWQRLGQMSREQGWGQAEEQPVRSSPGALSSLGHLVLPRQENETQCNGLELLGGAQSKALAYF